MKDAFNKAALGGQSPAKVQAAERFFRAAREDDAATLSQILSAQADGVTWRDKTDDSKTPLICAAENRAPEVAKLLIGAGAPVDAQTGRGTTALIFASHAGSAEIVQMLCAAGANVNHHNRSGTTALMGAAWSGSAPAAAELLKRNCGVNAQDIDGMTALMFAAQQGHKDVILLLLQKGADKSKTNAEGQTAGEIADSNGFGDLARMIESFAVPAPKPRAATRAREKEISEMIEDLQASAKQAVKNINTPAPAPKSSKELSSFNSRLKKAGFNNF